MTLLIRLTSLLGTGLAVALLVFWLAANNGQAFLWSGCGLLFVSALLWVGANGRRDDA